LPPSAEEIDVTDTDKTAAARARDTYGESPQAYLSESDDWSGWISFAGVMMLLLGTFQLIQGLVAIFSPTYYVVGSGGLVVSASYGAWGWVHLLLGVLIVAAGFGVMVGKTWARVTGIVLASLSAIVNLAFIGAYPLWGIVLIAVDIMVIYSLATHRRGLPA
jgi:hypothetical protein